jgi:hypothetical protein
MMISTILIEVTITQIGLLADILGVLFLVPNLIWTKIGIPFHPTVWSFGWWRLVTGVLLVTGGFILQFVGTI